MKRRSFRTPSRSAKMNSALKSNALLTLTLVAILGSACLSFTASAQTSGREIIFPTTIRWNKQRRVARYRLQIAADEEFQNVFFDGPITGDQYTVSALSAGYYYWRVAPAGSHTSNYSKPARFFVSGGLVTTMKVPNRATGARPIVSSKVR
jgi:hypothetical protein